MSKTVRKKFKFNKVISLILLISSIYIIYNILLLGPIEPLIRYILIGIIILINLIILLKSFGKKKTGFALTLIMLLLIAFNVLIGSSVNKVYNSLSKITTNKTVYSSSLVILESSDIKSIDSMKNKNICIINDTSSNEGYIIPNEMIKEYNLDNNNEIKNYDDYPNLLHALYNKDCDAAFLPTNYESMFSNIDEYKNIGEDIKILKTETKKASSSSKSYGTKKITEPFTMLLIGVDSSKDGLGNSDSFNGDSLMLVTFNPNTLNATILSIPRDSYVPIACFAGKYENKITHAAWKGTNCVIDTIEDFTDIEIDYYAKINFKGLVSLVDALGGITVEVPKDLCTDSSDRKGKVCIKKGIQTLNGEEALVLARNRKQLANGDLDRGLNQQKVLQGILNSAKKINSTSEVYKILDVISNNIDTNMSTETILSFYEVGKNILTQANGSDDLITLEQLYLAGTGQTIYDENTKLNLWNYILNKQSVEDVVKEMKINLELEDYEMITEFDYSINDTYAKKIIGKGPYKVYTTYDLVPDLTKYTKSQALAWASKYGVTIKFNEVTKTGKGYYNGQIIAQEYPFRKRIDKIPNKTMTVDIAVVSSNTTNTTTSKIDCESSENLNNTTCLLPDFTSMTKSQITTWKNKFSNNIVITYIEATEGGEDDQIINQSIDKGTHIKDLNGNSIILTIVKKD